MSATETLRKGRSLSHVKWILPHASVPLNLRDDVADFTTDQYDL